MQKLIVIFTIFTISCAFPNGYDDNEDIDHIVGGHKANSGTYNFLVNFVFFICLFIVYLMG